MKNTKKILFTFFVTSFGLLLAFNNLSSQQTAGELFEKALYIEEAQGDLQKAIDIYQKILKQFPENREVAAKTQLHIGICYEKLGLKEAQKAFQKVVDNYPEQTEAVKAAKEKLAILLKAQAVIEKGDKEFKITKIQTDTDKMALAFISPDGKKLAYVGVDGDIWVRDIASGKDTRLTQTPMFDYWCFWSHDSEMIAYLDVLNGLHLVSAKGGEPKTLIEADSEFRKAGNYAWPALWSPNLKMIICYIIPSKSIVSIPISGGEWKEIFKFSDPKQAEDVEFMAISPNCKLIAYSSNKSGIEHIYIMPVEGGESVQITHYPALYSILSWSFDGKWLAFETTRSGYKEIWVVRVSPDGKPLNGPFRVHGTTDPSFGTTFLKWTKDKKLGICASRAFSNIFIIDLESKKETQLTSILGREERPLWSPDGKKIAFISDREGKRNIWTMPSNGGEASLITGNITSQTFLYISSPTWSPDGKNIAFKRLGDNEGIWIVPAEGGPAEKVRFDYDGSVGRIDWSPDGKKIAFDYSRGKGDKYPIPDSRIDYGDIYTISVDGGEPTRVTKAEKEELDFKWPRWSPNGKKIAVITTDWAKYQEGKESEAIWIVDNHEGGKLKKITKDLKGFLHGICWSPDGENIIFSMRKKDKLYLHTVSSEGGEIQDLNIEGYLPDYSPDGKKIAFTRLKGKRTEFWIIENFLPEKKPKRKKSP